MSARGWQQRGWNLDQRVRASCCAGLLLAICSATACEPPPRRLPYIPPTLHNWPQPYRGVPGLHAHAFVTAHLEVPEALVVHGGRITRSRALAAVVLALQHPREGVILLDSGVSEATPQERIWPQVLPLLEAPPIRVSVAGPLLQQLQKAGIRPQAVRWIVQTNLRAVRTGYLTSFPQARVVASRAEFDFALQRDRPGYAAEILRQVTNWQWVDFSAGKPVATFPMAIDFFGDGSLILVEARGPTPGTLAALVRLPRQPAVWAGDVVPLSSTFRTAAEPRGLWSADEWWLRFWQIKRFSDLVEPSLVLPAFELPSTESAGGALGVHALPAPATVTAPRSTPQPWERFLPRPW